MCTCMHAIRGWEPRAGVQRLEHELLFREGGCRRHHCQRLIAQHVFELEAEVGVVDARVGPTVRVGLGLEVGLSSPNFLKPVDGRLRNDRFGVRVRIEVGLASASPNLLNSINGRLRLSGWGESEGVG